MRLISIYVVLSLNIFTLTISQQTICCFWPCVISIETPPTVVTHRTDIYYQTSMDPRLEYIFFAPMHCPLGQQSINGVCRKIYGGTETGN